MIHWIMCLASICIRFVINAGDSGIMEVEKGDKVLFEVKDKPLDSRIGKLTVGIVKFRQGQWIDLLCKGEGMDYRTTTDKITKKHENVFEAGVA